MNWYLFFFKKVVLLSALLSTVSGCSSDKKKATYAGATLPTSSAEPGSGTPTGETPPNVDKIIANEITNPVLFTVDAAQNTCTEFSFVITGAAQPIVGIEVAFAMTGHEGGQTSGKIDPATTTTDAAGVAKGTYCSDKDEVKVVIIGKVGTLSANTGVISVTKKPVYLIKYLHSDLIGSKESDTEIRLNTIDSGPNDCTFVHFAITKSDTPVMNKVVRFVTQADYPKGSKLAIKTAAGASAVDALTGKKYAYYDALSNVIGDLSVPVCAGTVLGSIQLSGSFTDENGKVNNVKSPLINITAGLTYFSNLSLTYDPMNAKTLTGYFNTNSDRIQPFWVKAGARQDGLPVTDFPIYVAAETGRTAVENNGFPSDTDGTVKFTMQALHMVNYRPYQINLFANSEGQTRCDPIGISASGGISYVDLAKNWRSTLVYAVRGQEAFYDANRNGIYDAGGHGFWDKNQNGIFDSGDVVTFDPDNDGLFSTAGEWFIDLPTPFIDVDEDGTFNSSKDILLGDEYIVPNGKRDADTMIWKSDYIPIYMGSSTFSICNGTIRNGTLQPILETDTPAPLARTFFNSLNTIGVRSGSLPELFQTYQRNKSYDEDDFFGPAPTANQIAQYGAIGLYLYAHGVCGNLPPGGTDISVNFEQIYTPSFGSRSLAAHFYLQAEDTVREPSRHLLSIATGASSTKINFNAIDHPSAQYGYPVEFSIDVAPCLTPCTGNVAASPGVACDGLRVRAHVTVDRVTLPVGISIPSVSLCNCLSGPASAGVCPEPP